MFPIDPAAWMILLSKHHSDLISDEAKALQTSQSAYDPTAEKPNVVVSPGLSSFSNMSDLPQSFGNQTSFLSSYPENIRASFISFVDEAFMIDSAFRRSACTESSALLPRHLRAIYPCI